MQAKQRIMQTIYQTAKPFDQLLKKQKVKKGETYRPMYYVVEQPVDEGLLLYHTMTKALLLLTPEEAETYKTTPTALPQLVEEWFLVPLSHDDRLLSRQIRDVARMLEKKTGAITNYTILTTTDCNARCFYCFERGRPRKAMSQETAIKTADYIISHSKGEKVTIKWFGGEPLYNKPAITLISQRLKKSGIEFSSKITTNGYLFDDENINEAKDLWQLELAQITLDGTEKIYNRSKAYIYKGVNAYQRVIDNIHRLQNAGIHTSIRLNIDIHNAEDLSELADELHREFNAPKDISVYLHILYEDTNGSKAMHDEQKRKFVFEKMEEIESRLKGYGFQRLRRTIREIRTFHCIADNNKSIVILPDGHIGKCEHYTEDHFVSHIESEEWDVQMIDNFREVRHEIKACTACFDYPNCIWLKLCEAVPNCYFEDRQQKLYGLRKKILSDYQKHKDNQEDEI